MRSSLAFPVLITALLLVHFVALEVVPTLKPRELSTCDLPGCVNLIRVSAKSDLRFFVLALFFVDDVEKILLCAVYADREVRVLELRRSMWILPFREWRNSLKTNLVIWTFNSNLHKQLLY